MTVGSLKRYVLVSGVVVFCGACGSGGARGGSGGSSGTGGAQPGTGGSGTGGALGSGGSPGGGSGGAGVDAAAGDGAAAVDADPDAAPCSPTNTLFDCPEYFACDAQTLRCTKACSSTQACHGGCCRNGTCEMGTEQTACGHDGKNCGNCTNTLTGGANGMRCLTYPTMDVPPLHGGYCSCTDVNDCATFQRHLCKAEFGTRRCCYDTGTSCTQAASCCSGVCAIGQCG